MQQTTQSVNTVSTIILIKFQALHLDVSYKNHVDLMCFRSKEVPATLYLDNLHVSLCVKWHLLTVITLQNFIRHLTRFIILHTA